MKEIFLYRNEGLDLSVESFPIAVCPMCGSEHNYRHIDFVSMVECRMEGNASMTTIKRNIPYVLFRCKSLAAYVSEADPSAVSFHQSDECRIMAESDGDIDIV